MWVITFPSIYHAFRAEKLLKAESIKCKLIPVPRELSAACDGLAAQIEKADLEQAVSLLSKHSVIMTKPGVEITSIH